MNKLLSETAQRAIRYIQTIDERNVFPTESAIAALSHFNEPFPATPTTAEEVIRLLDDIGSPATVASTGRRYFGFVTGGVLPAALAANWLAGTWDQNSSLTAISPLATKLEEITLGWLIDLFGLFFRNESSFKQLITKAHRPSLSSNDKSV